MDKYPFRHDSKVHIIADDRFQVVYYSRGCLKYKRVRDTTRQNWSDTIEEEIDDNSFWMVVACVELAKFTRR